MPSPPSASVRCGCPGGARQRLVVAGSLAAAMWVAASALALDVVGYSSAVNNRFTSGYPTAPVTNTGTAFIGRAIVAAAETRSDSRGAHFRSEHPEASPLEASAYTVVRAAAETMTAGTKPVTFSRVRPGQSLVSPS